MRLLLLSLTMAAMAASAPLHIRPSIAAFRPPAQKAPQHSIELRGGAPAPRGAPARGGSPSVETLKLDPSLALKLNAGMLALFATLCIPHSPIPLIDFTGKRHPDQVSMLMGSEEEGLQTEEVDKTLAWLSWGWYWVAGANLAASESSDEDMKKDLCKLGALFQVVAFGLNVLHKSPLATGCHISSALLFTANTIAGFGLLD